MLREKRCVPCEGGTQPLNEASARALMQQLSGRWKFFDDLRAIQATFEFKNYYETTAFVNAVAFVAHREDHHPDIAFGYHACTVKYWTHAIGGLSENDFICAAKIDALLLDPPAAKG